MYLLQAGCAWKLDMLLLACPWTGTSIALSRTGPKSGIPELHQDAHCCPEPQKTTKTKEVAETSQITNYFHASLVPF